MHGSKRHYVALAAALAAFAASGGIHATQTALEAEGAAPPETVRQPGVEARIPFVNHGGVRNWRADGSNGLYVQDVHGQWYHASLMGPCSDLPFAETIGFETRGPDTLDRFGSVRVRGQSCAFSSFVTSAAPPAKKKDADKS